MTKTAIAKKKVFSKYPDARLVKSSISSWGVCLDCGLFLSYGHALPHLAWAKAARDVSSTSTRSHA